METFGNFSEDTQYGLKRTFMECSLIFTMNKNNEMNTLKGNMFLQAVLAIMVEAQEPCTAEEAATMFRQKTGRVIEDKQFVEAFVKLKKLGYITPHNSSYTVHGQLRRWIQEGMSEIKTMYEQLVDELVSQLKDKVPIKLTDIQQEQAKKNIQEAMTLYAKLHGMENLVNEDNFKDDEDENEDIIKSAKMGLDDLTGNLLVEVLSDVISNPTPFQLKTINLLMQSFISAQIMQIDPLLEQFEKDKLRSKTFIFDTDFVLNSITKHHSLSNDFRKLIKTLRKIGCNIVIPQEVLEEVIRHARRAEPNNSWFANSFEVLNDEYVEKEATNVFVKDYYMWKFKTKKADSIRKFMRDNYYDESKPDVFMKGVIENELKCKVLTEELQIPDELKKHEEELKGEIKKEIQLSFKNKWRDKEETESLAKTDSTLYLYTMSENEDARKDNNNDILSATAYLITYTTKSIRCAKAMGIHQDIVTRPEILINILQRIGEFDNKGKMGLELFDNPFLTYVMRQNWQTVKKLADFGVDLHGKSITRLEYDLEEVLHELITEDAEKDFISPYELLRGERPYGVEHFFKIFDDIKAKNYTVIPMLQQMAEQYKNIEKTKDKAIADKERLESVLARKAHGYQEYIKKVSKAGKKKGSAFLKKKFKKKK